MYEARREKMVVALCSPQAQKCGVRAGMPLAEAKALPVQAHYETCAAEADRATLRRLAWWCQRFGPWVAVEGADSLVLDVTGCGPVFGGEDKLAKRAVKQLAQLGFVAKAAVAPTIGAAWALAHYQSANALVVQAPTHRQALGPLPLEALRLGKELLPLLRQFDIRTIDQLRQLPRAALPARFGLQVLERLDQAFGDVAEPFIPEIPSEPVEASWEFECPCSERRLVEFVLKQLLQQMLAKLQPQQLGVQRLRCTLQVLGSEPCGFTVGLLHANDGLGYLLEMLRLHLDRVRLPAEITRAALRAELVVPLEFRQGQMFAEDSLAERWARVPALVELLSNRLGKQAVLRPRLLPEAQPEFAWRYEPWLEQDIALLTKSWEKEKATPAFLRPLVLEASPIPIAVMSHGSGGAPLRFSLWNAPLSPVRRGEGSGVRGEVPPDSAPLTPTPLPPEYREERDFECPTSNNRHGDSFTVARHWGPERIETGWWRGRHVRRDYYHVETTSGARFWLFRETEGDAWFLHGVFA